MDVHFSSFIFIKIIRTLDQEAFDNYVETALVNRKAKIIAKEHEIVNILPAFKEKLNATNLISSNGFDYKKNIAGKGKASLIMKASSKPRKTKEELAQSKQKFEEEKKSVNTLKNAQNVLNSKGIRFERVPEIVDQNEKLIHYLQAKNLFDDKGNLK